MDKGKKQIEEEEFEPDLMDSPFNYCSSPLPSLSLLNGEELPNLHEGSGSVLGSGSSSNSNSDPASGSESSSSKKENPTLNAIDDINNMASNGPQRLCDDEAWMEVLSKTILPDSRSVLASVVRPKHSRKGTISPQMLADLATRDPRRAKRILTNRVSAVKAKEKKRKHAYMLEQQVQALAAKSDEFNSQLLLVQQEGKYLATENYSLKEQTSIILEQIQWQDSLNEEIRNEIQHLKRLTQINHYQSVDGYPGDNNHAGDTLSCATVFPPQPIQDQYFSQHNQY
ncbi:hypothetical protein Tsubulata_014871 [Turnera subulata]|uniref:BZIP domain-containing protein n=1 Tax=Turnera subulata TaxID=218843 RepID=A0A9Q0GDB8_9ROSI|nr:hypothetical protein Tsubulata_014871 [Turnera subulata]